MNSALASFAVILAVGAGTGPSGGDARFAFTAAERDETITRWTTGYQPEGKARQGQLEAFQPVPVQLKRGRCYKMVLRLGPEAAFSASARAGVSFVYKAKTGGADIQGGPGIHGPGGVGSAGCPDPGGSYDFDLQVSRGRGDPKPVHDLGTGAYTPQLLSKPIDETQLAAQKADVGRQVAEQDQSQKASVRKACIHCSQQKDECFDGKHRPFGGSCTDEYRSCLQSGWVRDPAQCFPK